MADTIKSIAVVGANGRVSSQVARAFHQEGWQVFAITGKGYCKPLADIRDIENRSADAMDKHELIEACQGAQFIFNGLNPPNFDWTGKAMPMARNVVYASKAHQAVHLFPANIYNYGSQLPFLLDENTPMKPDHEKAKIRCEMEALFKQAAIDHGLKTIILRAGDFFGGTQTGSWFDLVVAAGIDRGKITIPGDRNAVHAWAYLPDLAAGFVHLAETADRLPAFSSFNFHGHNVTGEQMHAAVEEVMGQSLKKGRFPKLAISIASWFSPMMQNIKEVFYLWERSHTMQSSKLEASALPQTQLKTAVKQALTDLGKLS